MVVHGDNRMVAAVAKPWSISIAIMRSRWPALSPPITDADQPAIVTHRRHHEIEAGGDRLFGLEPIGALVGSEHAIVVLEDSAA